MSNAPHDRPSAPHDPTAHGAGHTPGYETGYDAAAARPGDTHVPAGHTAGHPGDARTTTTRAASSAPRTVEPGTERGGAEPNQAGTTGTVPVDPALDAPAKRGVSGTVWAALIAGVVVLILLLVFILQNNVGTHFEYLVWSFSLPLGVAMLLSAIAGALIMALVGSVRIFTLGHRLRKLERERERIRQTLAD
ncbi:lipopolysaccharide assembly LapA domain-containing protein [Kocuria sp.]|uniref:LapA family protein n=1 Tax=Kocuria sp. TaxID=1871328 RepID=UPI0026DB7198|nr:LapA family protein [Kocuria sp.]MDO4918836.1 LapA family protein [Kocuria sp.]